MQADHLNSLIDKKDFDVLKGMKIAPQTIKDIIHAVSIILYNKKNEDSEDQWAIQKKMISHPKFLEDLLKFDKSTLTEQTMLTLDHFLS